MEPRIRHNDYSALECPRVGQWEPRLAVSVVIPAYNCQTTLDLTLASLAAQSYPSSKLEVIVSDDGSDPALRVPDIAPPNTRIISNTEARYGRAHACHQGAAVANGDVIHWLDADMVAYREHVEVQMRWHHVASYLVVLGEKRFIDYQPGDLSPEKVHAAVSAGRADTLFDAGGSTPHDWIERILARTSDLRTAGSMAYRVHVGSTASVTKSLYTAAGGMDTTLDLGEDSELGYRLAQMGAVFIPDREARSWHLGPSSIMRSRQAIRRYNEPFIVDRDPLRRRGRQATGRSWLVPYVDVVVDVADQQYEVVRATIDAVLASTLPDVRVTAVGPWRKLEFGTRPVLADPHLDLRLVRATYAHDGRVVFVNSLGETSFPATFRFVCPAGWAPRPDTLEWLTSKANDADTGIVRLNVQSSDGIRRAALLERTAAISRALLVRLSGEPLEDVVAQISGIYEIDGQECGVVSVANLSMRSRHGSRLRAGLRHLAKRMMRRRTITGRGFPSRF